MFVYHCVSYDVVASATTDDGAVDITLLVAYCGHKVKACLWDRPAEFIICTDWSRGDRYCKLCLKHPDLALLFLAEV